MLSAPRPGAVSVGRRREDAGRLATGRLWPWAVTPIPVTSPFTVNHDTCAEGRLRPWEERVSSRVLVAPRAPRHSLVSPATRSPSFPPGMSCLPPPPPPRGHGSGTHVRDQGPPRATRLPGFQMPPRGTVSVSGFLHARRHGGAFVRQRVCGMPAVPGGVGRVRHPRRGPHGHRGVVSDRSVTRRVSGRVPR